MHFTSRDKLWLKLTLVGLALHDVGPEAEAAWYVLYQTTCIRRRDPLGTARRQSDWSTSHKGPRETFKVTVQDSLMNADAVDEAD